MQKLCLFICVFATPLIFVISTWFLEVLSFFAKQHVDLITDHDIFLEADFN